MKKIVLLRHGKSELDGRYVGFTDCGLSLEGREQVKKLENQFAPYNFGEIIVSPLARCIQTAHILGFEKNLQINEDLKEIHFGAWEGLEFSQIQESYKEELKNWMNNPMGFTFPGGECIEDFQVRIGKVYDTIIEQDGNEDILIVAHGGVIRFLLCYFLNFSSDCHMRFDPKPGKYCVLQEYDKSCSLLGFNLS